MSNRVSGLTLFKTAAFAALFVSASALSGCSMMGSRLFGDPMVTGSTNGSPQLRQGQPAPVLLSSSGNSGAQYVPPADIGSSSGSGSLQVASAGPGKVNNVTTQPLPPLVSSSAVGSNKNMTAQPSIERVEVASTPPSRQIVQAAPKLAVVPENPYLHTIASGESLYTIARRYGVSADEIVRANSLASADKIFVGQKVIIPGKPEMLASKGPVTVASRTPELKPGLTHTTKTDAGAETQLASTPPVLPQKSSPVQTATGGAGKFLWPVNGKVIVDFAGSKGVGINIEAPEGAAVKAAGDGTVIYVGSAVEGYGNLILIKHENGFVSAYAHLKDTVVAKGDHVASGETIGAAGMTGAVTTPQLHFELRKGATPVDPLPMMTT